MRFRLNSRLPITSPILDEEISAAASLEGSAYQICQFRAMCSLAFYAFLQTGEMASSPRRHVVLIFPLTFSNLPDY